MTHMLDETDKERPCRLLLVAAEEFAARQELIWSSYDSGSDIARVVLDCRKGIEQGTITLAQKKELWRIFAPTCDWDDVVGDVDLGNEIFALADRLYWEEVRSDKS